ncbi:MAG TPA: hypothetical protein VGI81_10365 [Tepidisphaeraceae bacterium]
MERDARRRRVSLGKARRAPNPPAAAGWAMSHPGDIAAAGHYGTFWDI